VREALSGVNARPLDKSKLIREPHGEVRISELTPLMVACLMGNMQTAKTLVEHARALYLPDNPEDFRLFVDVRIAKSLGGNNALLYACTAGQAEEANYLLVKYLIDEAGADPNIANDSLQNALLLSAKRNQLNVVDLLFTKAVDINAQDKNGCNALHIASSNGFLEMAETILLHRAKVAREVEVFDIDSEDSLTLTALMKASINDHLDVSLCLCSLCPRL
jgi:ankyrin repeat protein